jgi:hypothetical protein
MSFSLSVSLNYLPSAKMDKQQPKDADDDTSLPGLIKLRKIIRIPGTDSIKMVNAYLSPAAIDVVETNPVTQRTRLIFCYGGATFDVLESVEEVNAMIAVNRD